MHLCGMHVCTLRSLSSCRSWTSDMYVCTRLTYACMQELERLQKLDEQQRKVLEARKHVENEILQTRCPACQTAFYDFTGCFALKCES